MTPVSHPPYSSDLAPCDIFFPSDKKSPQRKTFADVEEMRQKIAEALKGIETDEFKMVLSSGKKVLIGILYQMESTLKITEVETCKNKYTIFIYKFCVLGPPSYLPPIDHILSVMPEPYSGHSALGRRDNSLSWRIDLRSVK